MRHNSVEVSITAVILMLPMSVSLSLVAEAIARQVDLLSKLDLGRDRSLNPFSGHWRISGGIIALALSYRCSVTPTNTHRS